MYYNMIFSSYYTVNRKALHEFIETMDEDPENSECRFQVYYLYFKESILFN